MNLYVTTLGSKVGTSAGKIEVTQEGSLLASYPMKSVDCVSLYTGVNVTPAVIREFSEERKNIFWINSIGRTYACIFPPGSENIDRRKKQFILTDNDEFRKSMATKFISAKLSNQTTFFNGLIDDYEYDKMHLKMDELKGKLAYADGIDEIMGIEGLGARIYFETLSSIIPPQFDFERRTKQPPRDCYSALLSFLYMLLHNECVAAIQGAGLDPNVGIMHKLKSNHYALASDIMEEFRALIADKIAFELVKNGTITAEEDFEYTRDDAVFLCNKASKKVIGAYENVITSHTNYKKRKGFGQTFKDLISIQVYELVNAIEYSDPEMYSPVVA